ncbi:MAG: alpha/beta hydrolase [Actinomycetota bacterium]|nr:alpha/beta hydrolase [Actinomycetota bacterium]
MHRRSACSPRRQRAALDLAALLATWPVLTTAPRGDGHPVLVLPGLLTGDPATVLLRNVLRLLGHRSAGGASARTGPYRRVVGALRDRLDRLHQESGRRVSLVGWSLGGLYAEELARASPGSVRTLVTLGSAVAGRSGWARDLSTLVDRSTYLPRAAGLLPRPWAERGTLRVPATSVYTRSDGIVSWAACRFEPGARREDVECGGATSSSPTTRPCCGCFLTG